MIANESDFPPRVVLTIAGSDSGGGAGIQADLKTFEAFGVFGTTAVTAITAQNTQGVTGIHLVPPAIVSAQIEAVVSDFPIASIKIGMLGSAEIVCAVVQMLQQRIPQVPVVLDPVMCTTSGHTLLPVEGVAALQEKLLPLATVITPNAAEAALLLDRPIVNPEDLKFAAFALAEKYPDCSWLVKGGHTPSGQLAVDWLVTREGATAVEGPWISTPNTHGTGCTLSSAIAAGLALGRELLPAVRAAKSYLSQALQKAPRGLGHGNGPLMHRIPSALLIP